MKKFWYFLSVLLFTDYVLIMAWQMFFGPYRSHGIEVRYNLIPFTTIARLLKHYHHYNFEIWFINLGGNIITFIPLGLLVPIIFKRYKSMKHILALTGIVVFTAEVLQLTLQVGIFDIDDILLNILGAVLGFGLYKVLLSLLSKTGVLALETETTADVEPRKRT